MRQKVIYISGKYSGDVETNIRKAREAAIAVWEAGFTALCPHLNTAHFDNDCKCTYEDYINGDLALITNCNALLMLHDWEESKGAIIERTYALERGIPVFYNINELKEAYK
jgi:nucleoside 2-deoxyribosyltransferase